ncbi:hypothetical protein VSU19_14295 [Verrucomicrobiales bacterium BCK34]|nr:hypothetical protein [Verrucomicrobiales bacterium BCK34]
MKYIALLLSVFGLSAAFPTAAGAADEYTFFVRQLQMPDEAEWDMSVEQNGQAQSPLAINPNGARFELWTVKSSPLTSYLLDTTYVNSYIPVAQINIITEDPYDTIRRTRADRPFSVDITVSGMSTDPDAPEAAKTVKLLHHAQSYGANGTGAGLDRSQATLLSQGSLTNNGTHTLSYDINAVPGAVRTEVRGEERFSVYSLEDYEAPESQLASEFIQVWPVAYLDSLTGMENDEVIRGKAPHVKATLKDLYPDSWTYAQIYPGPPVLGTQGTIVPGSSFLLDNSVPRNSKKIHVKNWDEVITDDGEWTLEIITITPFGADRLAYRTFEVERTIKLNGNVTSVE